MKAFTRAVSPKLPECALTHLDRTPIDVAKAVAQHAAYERADDKAEPERGRHRTHPVASTSSTASKGFRVIHLIGLNRWRTAMIGIVATVAACAKSLVGPTHAGGKRRSRTPVRGPPRKRRRSGTRRAGCRLALHGLLFVLT